MLPPFRGRLVGGGFTRFAPGHSDFGRYNPERIEREPTKILKGDPRQLRHFGGATVRGLPAFGTGPSLILLRSHRDEGKPLELPQPVHEIFKSVRVIDKPASKIISAVDGDHQPVTRRGVEGNQSSGRIGAGARRALRDSVEVDGAHEVGRHNRLEKAAAGERQTDRALQLEDGSTGVAGTNILSGDATVGGILKEKGSESALAEHKEPHQGSELIVAGRWVVAQKIEYQRKLPQGVGIIERPQLSS